MIQSHMALPGTLVDRARKPATAKLLAGIRIAICGASVCLDASGRAPPAGAKHRAPGRSPPG